MANLVMVVNEPIIPPDFESAANLLRSLITARKLLKSVLKDRAVAAAIDLVGESIVSGNDQERLEAVSILGKAAEVSKPVAAVVQPLLKVGLISQLPFSGTWGTAHDRYYLAKGASVCEEEWVASYAAVELARGSVTERLSRGVWAEIAVNRAGSLACALKTAADAMSEDHAAQGYSVDTASRKLNLCISALGEPLSIADVPVGEGFGKAFSRLVSRAGNRNGPESSDLRVKTALNVLDVMIQILRLQFAATLDSDIYRAAGIVLGWWKPASPPGCVATKLNRITLIAMNALHLLARQGVSKKVLRQVRQALTSAFGVKLVNRIGSEIASKDPSLDTAIAYWLSTGKTLQDPKINPAVREMNEQALDELVANLLLLIDNQEGGPQVLELMADDIEPLEPGHARTVLAGAKRFRLVAQSVHLIGRKRRLTLSGERGELVKYDPVLHETVHDIQPSALARISVPGVIKQLDDRPATIIKKTQIEAR